MSTNHMMQPHKSVWGLKIAQAVLSVIVLGLAAYNVSIYAWSASALAVFTALFSIIILAYYLICLHATPQLYNWIAVLVLEVLAVIFWLATWADLAAIYAVSILYSEAYSDGDDYYYDGDSDDDSYYTKRDLSKRDSSVAYGGVFAACLAFSIIQFILFCVTLGFIGVAAHRHRKNNRPMQRSSFGAEAEGRKTEV